MKMHDYEAPTLMSIGSIADLTMGDFLSPGQDHLSQIPVVGGLFGS